jgi:sodium transport system permease protein
MLRALWTIFAKETLDLVRDRRALFLLLAPPLLMPLLYAMGGAFIVWQAVRQTRGGLPVAVINGEQLPGLVAKLGDNLVLQLADTPSDTEEALQGGELMAVLEIPPDAAERLQAEEPITLTLTSSRSGWLPDIAVASIRGVLSEYGNEVLAARLAQRGLDQAWMEPIHLERASAAPTGIAAAPVAPGAATPSSLSSLFIPLTIAMWSFSGGLNMVAYMTVGEKEHHTMETLLVTPASRIGIVLGKIALSIIVSIITIGLWSLDSLGYMWLLAALPTSLSGLAAPFTAGLENLSLAIVWLVLLMLPLTTMANSLVAAVCTFARNYREANLFLVALQLLFPGLALLAAFGIGAKPPLSLYALPVVGVLVAMRDLLGGGIAPAALALTWVTAAGYAAAAILLAAYIFSREWALMRGL